MSSKQVVMEVPDSSGSSTRLVLESDSDTGAVQMIRRGNDVFLVTPEHEIIAALVQMDHGADDVERAG